MPIPKIIIPQEPFVDPQTGFISRSWFRWLLSLVGSTDDATVLAQLETSFAAAESAVTQRLAQDALTVGSIQTPNVALPDNDSRLLASIAAPVSQKDQDARLVASVSKAPITRQDQDAKLLSSFVKQAIQSADQDARLLGYGRETQQSFPQQIQINPAPLPQPPLLQGSSRSFAARHG